MATKVKIPSALLLLLLQLMVLCSRSNGQLEISTIEGSSKIVEKPPVQSRSAGAKNVTGPKKFNCIVCDDIKDKHCQPWDSFSYSKNCYEDPRINKKLPIGCRKMIQYVGSKTYVSRQCTNLVDDSIQGCVDRVGTKKIKVVYCHCRYKQNCNDGARPDSGQGLLAVTAAIFVFAIMVRH